MTREALSSRGGAVRHAGTLLSTGEDALPDLLALLRAATGRRRGNDRQGPPGGPAPPAGCTGRCDPDRRSGAGRRAAASPWRAASGDKLAFLSGGSGATPLMAMLRHLATVDPHADVAWFHAARVPDEVLFAAELARLQVVDAEPLGVHHGEPGLSGLVRPSRPPFPPAPFRRDPGFRPPRGLLLRPGSPSWTRRELIHAAEGGRRDAFHTEAFGPSPSSVPVASAHENSDTEAAIHLLRVGERILQVRETRPSCRRPSGRASSFPADVARACAARAVSD